MPNMLLVVTGLSSSLLRPATLAFTIKGGAVIGAAAPYLSIYSNIPNHRYVFLGIYSAEMVIKSVARGFILNNYSYLRNPWNWLDFTVIASGYLTSFIEMGNLAGLRTFRVLRALKTVSIMPSKCDRED